MKIVQVSISKLREMPGNPRQITREELEELARSLKRFGMPQPVVVYAGPEREHVGEIIGGHQRVKAAKMLGWTKVPAILWRGPYRAAKALNLALNKIGGEWDVDLLAKFVQDIEDELRFTGFTQEELDAILPKVNVYDPESVLPRYAQEVVDEVVEEVVDEGTGVRRKRCVCCGRPL